MSQNEEKGKEVKKEGRSRQEGKGKGKGKGNEGQNDKGDPNTSR